MLREVNGVERSDTITATIIWAPSREINSTEWAAITICVVPFRTLTCQISCTSRAINPKYQKFLSISHLSM